MPARKTHEGADKIYDAAQKWVDCALMSDGSLFTPGEEIWSECWLGELRARFLDRSDVAGGEFYDRLKGWLEGCRPEVYQLMGEVLYVHFLIIWPGRMKAATKADRINRILSESSCPVEVCEELADCFRYGIADPGAGAAYRRYLVGFIIEFVERWKSLPEAEPQRLLDDPWAFKEMIWSFPLTSVMLVNRQNTPNQQRHARLHLVFPDTFEGTVASNHKEMIVNAEAFRKYVEDPADDTDRKINQIRQGLEAEPRGDFDFYDRDIRRRWKS